MNGKLIRNLIVILGYIILIVLWFLKYKKRLKSKKDYMKRAELYYTSKKWLRAIDLGNNALSKFQVSSEEEITILLIIANSYYGLKEYNLAIDYYEKAFKYTFSLNKE
jgi:tetratricopeptide (TPR) repeat protein